MAGATTPEGTAMTALPSTHPERLGRYEVVSVLGRGAMGIVYRGYDAQVGRPVALKTIHADLLRGRDAEDWRQRFAREARAAGRCLHPNIVTLFDVGEAEGVPYLAMEYVVGRALDDFLGSGAPFDAPTAVGIVAQVLDALGAAHAEGIVHRDIKPANVLVLDGGRVKVTDFGIARIDTADLTRAGTMIGTPSYMSPEQFTGDPVDARSDLFSAGVMLFELLCGRRPFAGTGTTEIMHKVLTTEPPDPVDLNPSLSPGFRPILARALAKAPGDRFPDAAAFLAALAAVDDATVVAGVASDATVVAGQVSAAFLSAGLAAAETALLKDIETDLAHHVGPIARVLVREAAANTSEIDEMCRQLAARIPAEREATEFLRRSRSRAASVGSGGSRSGSRTGGSLGGTAGSSRPGPSVSSAACDPSLEASALHHLTPILGPIARVLVRRAMAAGGDRAAVLDRLADEIPTEAERRAFLQAVGADG